MVDESELFNDGSQISATNRLGCFDGLENSTALAGVFLKLACLKYVCM
jgi:hypothetical protein